MLNVWTRWLPRWQLSLMPPSPSAPPPSCDWLDLVVRNAGLAPLLQAPPGLTLLAPTDAALEAAGHPIAQSSPEALQRWLLGHLTLASPHEGGLLPLLNGSLLRRAEDGQCWLDAAGQRVRMLGRPLLRQQLRVQPIDRPLATANQTLWQTLSADPSLSRLATALARSGLDELLACPGPFTLFAPSNAGLDRAAARLGLSAAALWQDPERLRSLLLMHVVPGRWTSAELPWPGRLRTLGDGDLALDALGRLRSGDLGLPLARGSDQPCSNGLMHRLTEALLPPVH